MLMVLENQIFGWQSELFDDRMSLEEGKGLFQKERQLFNSNCRCHYVIINMNE